MLAALNAVFTALVWLALVGGPMFGVVKVYVAHKAQVEANKTAQAAALRRMRSPKVRTFRV